MSVEPITEEDIAALTTVFYAWVRKDELLAPVFAAKVGSEDEEWAPHIQHINDFWSGIFLKTGRFSGNPMAKHAPLPGLTPAHFTRWLELFAYLPRRVHKPCHQLSKSTLTIRRSA